MQQNVPLLSSLLSKIQYECFPAILESKECFIQSVMSRFQIHKRFKRREKGGSCSSFSAYCIIYIIF